MNKKLLAVLAAVGIVVAFVAVLGLTRHQPSQADCKAAIEKAWVQSMSAQRIDRADACEGLDQAVVERLIGEVFAEKLGVS